MCSKKRVYVCGIAQESNCFNPVIMTMNSFRIQISNESKWENVTGAIAYLEENDVNCIYGLMMNSNSGAPLAHSVVDYFLNHTLNSIQQSGRLDGILLILHGATMSEASYDVCGDICEAIRRTVGEDIPISASFDLHANITEKIAKNLDYICGYHEYPHTDQRQTGERAAKMLVEHLKGSRMKTVRAAVPMIAPAHGYTTKQGALQALHKKAQAMIDAGIIADYSIFQVQPWLDTPSMSSAVTVIGKDEKATKNAAWELALGNLHLRKELQGTPLLTTKQVIERAMNNQSRKPVILVDSADSIGAGSTGDSADVIGELLPYSNKLRAAASVLDAATVCKAFELGVGAIADFTLGASVSPELTKPITVKNALVRSLHNGEFYFYGPIAKGSKANTGKTAVLEVGKLLIRVSEKPTSGRDINYYRSFGIDIENCDLVSVKACTSFRAGYEPIAAEICNTNTPGAAGTDLFTLKYIHRPKPLYPFEEISEDDIVKPMCYR